MLKIHTEFESTIFCNNFTGTISRVENGGSPSFIFPKIMITIIKCHKESFAKIWCNMIKFTGPVVWSGLWSTWWFRAFSIILISFMFIS